jgi:biotin carboxylase
MYIRPFLVVAGGQFQLPLIYAIKARSFPVAVVDGDPNAPGFKLADYHEVLDIANEEEVIQYAKRINPIAIASIVSEIAVTSVAAAVKALNLPGITMQTAEICTDKFKMRSVFYANGLPSPRFLDANNVEAAKLATLEIGMPVVIKPVDSSGSRGVTRVERIESVEYAYQAARIYSRSQKVIIESFLEGHEFTVETITVNGSTSILGFSKKQRIPFPHCVSVELLYFNYREYYFGEQIVNLVVDAINSVGLRNGAAHTEIILTKTGPVLVEIAARGGGYEIFTKILPEISGVNVVEAVIDLALGKEPIIGSVDTKCAVLKFFDSEKHGVIQSVSGIEEAKNIAGVIGLEIDGKIIGKKFNGITRDGERLGYMIVLGDRVSEVLAIANEVEGLINFDIN